MWPSGLLSITVPVPLARLPRIPIPAELVFLRRRALPPRIAAKRRRARTSWAAIHRGRAVEARPMHLRLWRHAMALTIGPVVGRRWAMLVVVLVVMLLSALP